MKYVYIDLTNNRVICICKQRSNDHFEVYSEYIVSDDFDMSKIIIDESGEQFTAHNILTAEEFLARFNNDYKQKRLSAYPKLEDQLDKIYHEGLDAWKAEIAEIKSRYPKP